MKNIADLIPDPSSLELPEPDYSTLGDLSKISLIRFVAEPETIGPFGSSVITWEVQDLDSHCSVQLNGVRVPITGSMRVSPNVTFPYYLKANNGHLTKDLGHLEVKVNTKACVIDDYPYVNQAFKTYLGLNVLEVTGLRLRGNAQEAISITTTTGNIHFELALEQVVDNMPDPHVNVRGDLGLYVANDGPILNRKRIHGFFRNLHIDADYTFWQWLKVAAIPGAVIAAPIILGSAKDKATNKIPELFDRIIGFTAIRGTAPVGMGIQNVSISSGSDGHGSLRRTFCPNTLPVGEPPRPRG